MNVLEDIRDVFSTLHDGEIKLWNGNIEKLTLTIECQYLAEKINNTFIDFYLEFYCVKDLYFSTWANPVNLPSTTLTDLDDIFKLKLEILSSDIDEGKVKVVCNHTDFLSDYCGGELFISSQDFKTFDQGMSELSINKLDKVCNDYWDNLNK